MTLLCLVDRLVKGWSEQALAKVLSSGLLVLSATFTCYCGSIGGIVHSFCFI